jgi:hypothetical protein
MLSGSIATVSAHFYASFHSSRKNPKPISRAKLAELTGVPERTQRAYEKLAKVQSKRNFVIAEELTVDRAHELAWQRGSALFYFADTTGEQGRKGTTYLAWHLPNTYTGPHATRSRGSQKRINRKLAVLYKSRGTGNNEQVVEKVFWPTGATAAKAINQQPANDAYWQRFEAQKHHFWAVFCAMKP